MTQTFKDCTMYVQAGMLGNILAISCREVRVTTGVSYAQYPNAIKVHFLEKGKRKMQGTVLAYKPYMMIAAGLTPPVVPPSALGDPEPGCTPGVTVRVGRHSACSPEW